MTSPISANPHWLTRQPWVSNAARFAGRHFLRAFVFTILVILVWCWGASRAKAQQIEGGACVVDGQTIRLGGVWGQAQPCSGGVLLQLWGIKTPEDGQPGYWGAARVLAGLLAGETLVCDRRGWDGFRSLAICRIGAQDIGRWMVSGGYARDCHRYSRGYYAGVDRKLWSTPEHARNCEERR